MSDPLRRRRALEAFFAGRADTAGAEAGVRVTLMPAADLVNLRARAGDTQLLAAIEAELGQPLPLAPNTVSRSAHCVYWLGPDEWLIAATPGDGLARRLDARLAGRHAAVNAQNGGLVTLRIAGAQARDLLSKGCTLDLDSDKFSLGQCAQTGLAKAAIVLALHDVAPVFDIIVRRSFADYLARWLAHAGTEFGVRFAATD